MTASSTARHEELEKLLQSEAQWAAQQLQQVTQLPRETHRRHAGLGVLHGLGMLTLSSGGGGTQWARRPTFSMRSRKRAVVTGDGTLRGYIKVCARLDQNSRDRREGRQVESR